MIYPLKLSSYCVLGPYLKIAGQWVLRPRLNYQGVIRTKRKIFEKRSIELNLGSRSRLYNGYLASLASLLG